MDDSAQPPVEGETCVFVEALPGKRSREMKRRGKDGLGTLIPLPQCPVWAGEVKNDTPQPQ